jgi:hypothetical protein
MTAVVNLIDVYQAAKKLKQCGKLHNLAPDI